MIKPSLYVADTGSRGLGVFSDAALEAGIIVETAPVIVMPGAERDLLDQTLLHDYIFEWGENSEQCCMALGYAAIYNHSYNSNCEYEMDFPNKMIMIRTVRAIAAGEELFINYNGDWDDQRPVWFASK
jgi:uncharacterized protein